MIVKISNRAVGLFLAALFLIAIVLIPFEIKIRKGEIITSRFFPYLIFSISFVLSILYAFIGKARYFEIDLSVWKMIASGIIYYLNLFGTRLLRKRWRPL